MSSMDKAGYYLSRPLITAAAMVGFIRDTHSTPLAKFLIANI